MLDAGGDVEQLLLKRTWKGLADEITAAGPGARAVGDQAHAWRKAHVDELTKHLGTTFPENAALPKKFKTTVERTGTDSYRSDLDLSQPAMQVEIRNHIARCLRDYPHGCEGVITVAGVEHCFMYVVHDDVVDTVIGPPNLHRAGPQRASRKHA